ncbi:V-type proton ATPase subunit H, partial [Nowakowskiella sp. JEL0078]
LDWSPPHLSEQFWKSNATRLNEKDYELLRILSRIIGTSSNNTVLAVAAHDIGQYVKYYPNGKKIVQEIGAKQQIMELMTNQDPDVRYQALLAVHLKKLSIHTKILVPSAFLIVIGGYIFSNAVSSQKQHSSLFKSLMFRLRHEEQLKRKLGNIIFDPSIGGGVKGFINNQQGLADIEFSLKGPRLDGGKEGEVARIKFKGRRDPNVPDVWLPLEFSEKVWVWRYPDPVDGYNKIDIQLRGNSIVY